MTDPIPTPPPMTLLQPAGRPMDGPPAERDDGTLIRLALWLAEVSADVARDATPPADNAPTTASAQGPAENANRPAPKVAG